MHEHRRGLRVQVFCGEAETVGKVPRYQALLEYLRREGAAGATVVRGIAGFGANSRIHSAATLRLSPDSPVIVTWIDEPARVKRLLPAVQELAGSGIVTVDEVEIASYGFRTLEQLRFDLPVSDVMTRSVAAVSADSPVREAVETLLDREFRALPVIDAANRVVGVVSGGDLVSRRVLRARIELLSALPPDARREFLEELPSKPVGEVMTPAPTTINAADTLAQAARLMSERKLKRLPVVNERGELVGVLARVDVLHAIGETFPRLATVEGPTDVGTTTVGQLMRAQAPTVNADADLATVLDAVTSTRLNRAIVVDAERRVVGVISDADVVRSVEPGARGGVVGALMRAAHAGAETTHRAAELVRGAALTVGPETKIADAARSMIESRHKVLCVVDSDGRLIGIVDRADLLRATGDALRELARPPDSEAVHDD